MPIETVTTSRDKFERVKGLPFIRIPGNPPEHRVYGEFDGIKVRAGGVEMVWNDMLLMDALDGPGRYAETVKEDARRTGGGINYQVLLVAERVFGMSPAQAVEEWLKMPKANAAGSKVQTVPMMHGGDLPRGDVTVNGRGGDSGGGVARMIKKCVAVVIGSDGYDRAALECGHQGKVKSDAKVQVGMGVYCVECAATRVL